MLDIIDHVNGNSSMSFILQWGDGVVICFAIGGWLPQKVCVNGAMCC